MPHCRSANPATNDVLASPVPNEPPCGAKAAASVRPNTMAAPSRTAKATGHDAPLLDGGSLTAARALTCGLFRSQSCDGSRALADCAVDLVIELRGLRLPGHRTTALGAGLVLNGHRSLRFQDPPMLGERGWSSTATDLCAFKTHPCSASTLAWPRRASCSTSSPPRRPSARSA